MPGAPGAAATRGAGTARGAGRGSTRRGRRPDDPANWIEDPAKKAKREQAQQAIRKGPPPGMPPAADPASGDPDEPAKPGGFDRSRFSSSSDKPAVRLPRPSLEPGDGAGFVLGLFVYALVVSYISYGPAGPKTWLKAKFLNQPGGLAKPSTSTSWIPAGMSAHNVTQ